MPHPISDGGSGTDGIRGRNLEIGWGMVKVRATIHETSVETSIFPDKNSASYLLPLKASVRKAARVAVGDIIRIRLDVIA
ncbi:DUF1905 domain-containing protein [Rhizobium sp. C4]|uniref:DUF1905 domain-containing protein n=1 Tax=Rhizobium sp. C4 TaxID=1349800 RepID=UPI001E3A5D1A|nr:DUF1905 domain-containing protein [Rhizobium sp. C4]